MKEHREIRAHDGSVIASYIGFCCREWILAAGFSVGRCGICGERPSYLRADE